MLLEALHWATSLGQCGSATAGKVCKLVLLFISNEPRQPSIYYTVKKEGAGSSLPNDNVGLAYNTGQIYVVFIYNHLVSQNELRGRGRDIITIFEGHFG